MSDLLKWLAGIAGAIMAVYIGYLVYSTLTVESIFDAHYSAEDLIKNYEQKKKEIADVKEFINQKVPAGKNVDIEFAEEDQLFYFHLTGYTSDCYQWNLEVNSPKTDSLLQLLGWPAQTLQQLKTKLEQANCISVRSGEPCVIGFQRSGLGKYFYNLFDRPIADTLRSNYNNGCTHILYQDNLVLEFGGGSVGPQCFESLLEAEH